MHRSAILVLTLVLSLIAGSAAAYTIYLRDGSRLIAREEYRIEGDKAIIVLQNGTQTFIDASEIDVERTLQANQGKHGTAFVIDDEGRVVEAPIVQSEEPRSLTDVSRRSPSGSARPPVTRSSTQTQGPEDVARTLSGSVDLTIFPRIPYRDLEIASDTSRFLRALGVSEFQIYQGTQQDRAFLEITTNSEASVFRGLEASADALLHLRQRFPGKIDVLEVLMTTSNRERAGQFVFDPETALQIAEKRIDTAAFFIANVQF